jgi:hypothetical protein
MLEYYKVDRDYYNHIGYWVYISKNKEHKELIYYHIDSNKTWQMIDDNYQHQIKATMTIIIYGNHKLVSQDYIELDTKERLKIVNITDNMLKLNKEIQDYSKPIIQSQGVDLE